MDNRLDGHSQNARAQPVEIDGRAADAARLISVAGRQAAGVIYETYLVT
jgi:hypothetical protein